MARGKIVVGRTTQYFIDDVEVTKEAFDKRFPNKGINELLPGQTPGIWPMCSEAMGIHPSQIAEAMERDRKAGVPTSYTPDGRPILLGRGHRKAYLRSYGMHDKQGGYGD